MVESDSTYVVAVGGFDSFALSEFPDNGEIVEGTPPVLGGLYNLNISLPFAATVAFADTTFSTDEGAGTSNAVTLVRTGAANFESSVRVLLEPGGAEDGIDFDSAGFPRTVTFAAGETQQVLPLPILEDDLVEGTEPERVELLLADAQVASLGLFDAATLEIIDNDSTFASVTATGAPVEEGMTAGTFAIARQDVGGDVTVNFSILGSATFGEDFTLEVATNLGGESSILETIANLQDIALDGANATVTIPDGAESIEISVVPIDDPFVDPSETVLLTLLEGEGYRIDEENATALLAIADADRNTCQDNPITGGQTGTTGNDMLVGTSGSDSLSGGRCNDNIEGGGGNDFLTGGRDSDTLLGGGGSDNLFGGRDNDILFGGEGDDTLAGNSENDNLTGDGGSDVLAGDDGDDTLNGGTGNDTLLGGAGNDILLGGAGDDVLEGDRGNNMLSGGSGSDVFVLQAGGNSAIADFQAGSDVIGLRGGMRFENLALVPDGNNTAIFARNQPLATLQGVPASAIGPQNFLLL